MIHLKFPSLAQFNEIFTRETWTDERRALTYRAKIKLHGSNAGIRINTDGSVTAQSRKKDLSPDNDLGNMAEWLEDQKPLWSKAAIDDLTVIFYGEWAGPGVARGDAVQQTDKKRFYIFALGLGEAPYHQDDDLITSEWMITCPLAIEAFLPSGIDRDRVRVLPWEDETSVVFDFADEAQIDSQLVMINQSVALLDEVDPYISRTFDIKGPGEGFVLVPESIAAGQLTVEQYSRMSFKTKTAKHRVRKQGRSATVREPLPQTAIDFVDTFCTPARLEQALQEVTGGRIDLKQTLPLIIWMVEDIEKEAKTEISALPVPFDDVKKMITDNTRSWFLQMAKGTR